MDSDATGQLLIIRIFFIHQILEKNCKYNEAVHQPFTCIDNKEVCDSGRKEVL